jgi:hypothetical protein
MVTWGCMGLRVRGCSEEQAAQGQGIPEYMGIPQAMAWQDVD